MKSFWPYYSNKYIQLSLIWSLIIHIILLFFTGSIASKAIPSHRKIDLQTVYIQKTDTQTEIVAEKNTPATEVIPPVPSDPLLPDNKPGSGIIESPLAIKPPSEIKEHDYDTPAKSLKPMENTDIEDLPENINLSEPLIVIKVWIDATGLVSKTEVISTQLDEFTTKKMAANIGSQLFIPAIKGGKGVPSTKIYITGHGA